MKLLLDIGNSSVNWAKEEQGQFVSKGVFTYSKSQLQQDLNENLSLDDVPEKLLLSNVAGSDIEGVLNRWTKKLWNCEVWIAEVETEFHSLKNSYPDIRQMGVDRWLAMVACWHRYQSAFCLVGCGTAMTIDVINETGQHEGGYIIPGITMMQTALVQQTEGINTKTSNHAALNLAKTTQDAINNGAFLAAVAMIDRVVNDFFDETDSRPNCIITGGMATTIQPLLAQIFEYQADLVLEGLLLTYGKT